MKDKAGDGARRSGTSATFVMEPCIKDRKFDGGAIHGSADHAACVTAMNLSSVKSLHKCKSQSANEEKKMSQCLLASHRIRSHNTVRS